MLLERIPLPQTVSTDDVPRAHNQHPPVPAGVPPPPPPPPVQLPEFEDISSDDDDDDDVQQPQTPPPAQEQFQYPNALSVQAPEYHGDSPEAPNAAGLSILNRLGMMRLEHEWVINKGLLFQWNYMYIHDQARHIQRFFQVDAASEGNMGVAVAAVAIFNQLDYAIKLLPDYGDVYASEYEFMSPPILTIPQYQAFANVENSLIRLSNRTQNPDFNYTAQRLADNIGHFLNEFHPKAPGRHLRPENPPTLYYPSPRVEGTPFDNVVRLVQTFHAEYHHLANRVRNGNSHLPQDWMGRIELAIILLEDIYIDNLGDGDQLNLDRLFHRWRGVWQISSGISNWYFWAWNHRPGVHAMDLQLLARIGHFADSGVDIMNAIGAVPPSPPRTPSPRSPRTPSPPPSHSPPQSPSPRTPRTHRRSRSQSRSPSPRSSKHVRV